jgi:hypothetical protein
MVDRATMGTGIMITIAVIGGMDMVEGAMTGAMGTDRW